MYIWKGIRVEGSAPTIISKEFFEAVQDRIKKIAVTSGIISVVGIAFFGVFGVKHYRHSFERWLKNAPLEELNAAREDVQSEYLKHTVNDEYRRSLWNLMSSLDKKINELAWMGKPASGPAYHREHGFHLYKPD